MIELLTVIGMLSILASITVMAMQQQLQERKITNVTDKLLDIFSQSRSFAMAQPATLGNKEYIEVTIANSNNGPKISYFRCNSINDNNCVSITPLVSDTSLPSSVYFVNNCTNKTKLDYKFFIFTDSAGPPPAPTTTPYQIGNMSTTDSTGLTRPIILTDGQACYQLQASSVGNFTVTKI